MHTTPPHLSISIPIYPSHTHTHMHAPHSISIPIYPSLTLTHACMHTPPDASHDGLSFVNATNTTLDVERGSLMFDVVGLPAAPKVCRTNAYNNNKKLCNSNSDSL